MTKNEFRILHSKLIEHYQFIEFNLEGIYAGISGKEFCSGLEDVDHDSIIRILNRISKLKMVNDSRILSEKENVLIKQANERRNFWVHECYIKLAFDLKTGGLKHQRDIEQMQQDLHDAEYLRELLFQLKRKLMEMLMIKENINE